MLAQLAFSDGDDIVGCGAIAAAKESVSSRDVELRNQLAYYNARCSNLAARMAARDTTATTAPAAASTPPNPAADSASRPAGSSRSSSTATNATREFSVQIAAYNTRAEAEAQAKRLVARGFSARVVGGARPYRVRIGRYGTRERAETARQQIGGRAIVVEAEPR